MCLTTTNEQRRVCRSQNGGSTAENRHYTHRRWPGSLLSTRREIRAIDLGHGSRALINGHNIEPNTGPIRPRLTEQIPFSIHTIDTTHRGSAR